MSEKIKQYFLLVLIVIVAGFAWGCPQPSAKLKVSRNEIKQGDPVTVSWEAKNAKTVMLDGKKVENIGAETVTPQQTTSYEVIAKRGKKEAHDKATIKVETMSAPAPMLSLRAEPSAVERGQEALLRWSTDHAKTVTIAGLGEVPPSGERVVRPSASTTYTGTAVGDGGTATASARVTVTAPASRTAAERPRGNAAEEAALSQQFTRAIAAIYFEFDQADLKPAEQEKLRRAADWLLQDSHRTISFRIEGNCDPRGTAEYNLGLGDRRARAARNFLTSLGVDASRISTISFGLEKAQGNEEGAPNSLPSWAHDRRDDFVYLGGRDLP